MANMLTAAKLDVEEEACTYATQLYCISILPMTLKAAIQLNLLEIISKAGPGVYLSPEEIAAHLPTNNPQAPFMVDRILRLLASYKIFNFSLSTDDSGRITRSYAAAPVCKFLTKNEDGVSMASLSLMTQERVYTESWNYMKEAVLDGGIPFNRANGMSFFEYCGTDRMFSTMFNEGMRSHSTVMMKKILEDYRGFDDVEVLVDVGGGFGASLKMIISKHPQLKCINFDLPFVIAEAPVTPGIEHVGGDMFSSVPSGDAIFMKWILQNWNDESCLKILMNCWKALPDNGKVVIVESVLPESPEATQAAQSVFQLDLAMQALVEGKVRTRTELEALAKEAGFSGFRALLSYSTTWVIEFSK